MAQSRLLNTYCRKIGPIMMVLLPAVILVLLFLGNFEPTSQEVLLGSIFWVLLLANSLTFTVNGMMIVRDFKKETSTRAEEGFPVDSLEGFSSMSKFTSSILISSSVIAIVIFLSLLLFLITIITIPGLKYLSDFKELLGFDNVNDFNSFVDGLAPTLTLIIISSAIGLAFIAFGIVLLLKIPEKPVFEPGSMLKYYVPQQTPIALDNLLSDAVFAFLDPITRLRMDEWTTSVLNSLTDSFEPDFDDTRLERAREKILLLFYLRNRMPALVTDEVFKSEIVEVIEESKYTDFKNGKASGISFDVLEEIFNRLLNQIPEIFKTIDRLVIELTDNLSDFKANEDLWVTVSAPEKVVGNRKPFRILVFALNRSSHFMDRKRLVGLHSAGSQSNFMEKIDYSLGLDKAEDLEIIEDKLPFFSDGGIDILGLLSKLLQIGDAVWFTFERRSFKKHMFSISITEGDKGSIFGTSVAIDVTRDINFYISQYGGQLSAIAGLLVPVGSFLLTML